LKIPRKNLQKYCQLAAPKNLSEKFSDFQEKFSDIKFSEFVRKFFRTQMAGHKLQHSRKKGGIGFGINTYLVTYLLYGHWR
jgi:hypothetical protein